MRAWLPHLLLFSISHVVEMESTLRRARHLAEDYWTKLSPESAVFWAEKAVLLSGGEVDDLVLYGQVLYASGQYKRAAHHLQSSSLLNRCSALRYLAAKCLAAHKSWEEVIALLTSGTAEEPTEIAAAVEKDEYSRRLGNVAAVTRLLLGRAYEAIGNTLEAINCYKETLLEDPFCEEALERLYCLHALQLADEQALVSELSFKQSSVEEELSAKYLYQHKLHHSDKRSDFLPDQLSPLANSIDVRSHLAYTLLQNMNIEKCHQLTKEILERDPYHFPTMLTHIASCVINKSMKELYALGQDLVKYFPELPLSWYTVASYYYASGKHSQMRRYLTKAINLDPHFAQAHFAFGLSFASEGEHDQAIAAFSHAARYMRTSYLPLMYLGKEYFVTGNIPIATSFFKNARLLAPNDPVLLQEVGLVLALNGHYPKAEAYFLQAASLLKKIDPHVTLPVWEPVYNNLGHVLRKQGKYLEALEAHKRALQLVPNEASTLSCIAFVYLLMENFDQVVQFCNRSLRLRREDRFTIELLQQAVFELAAIPVDFLSNDGKIDDIVYQTISEPTAMQTD